VKCRFAARLTISSLLLSVTASLPLVSAQQASDVGAGFVSEPTFAQQLVVVSFAMADVRNHGQQKAEVMSDEY